MTSSIPIEYEWFHKHLFDILGYSGPGCNSNELALHITQIQWSVVPKTLLFIFSY